MGTAPLEHRHATVNGIDMHYVEAGSGPLVVLLHGFPEFWYSWRHQIPALNRAGFRVVAPDLRGYNESAKPRPADEYRLTTLAADVAALIEHLGAPCVLAGHDWGGAIAWLVAFTRPELLRRLIVLNMPHPVPLSRQLKRSRRQKLRMSYQLFFQPSFVPEALMPFLLPAMLRRSGRFTPDEIAEYRIAWRKPGATRGMANYYRALWRHGRELRRLVRRIDVPTLLIFGERDPVFTRETTEDFDEWVPDLRVARVNAGHFVQTDEPETVSDLLIEFGSVESGNDGR